MISALFADHQGIEGNYARKYRTITPPAKPAINNPIPHFCCFFRFSISRDEGAPSGADPPMTMDLYSRYKPMALKQSVNRLMRGNRVSISVLNELVHIRDGPLHPRSIPAKHFAVYLSKFLTGVGLFQIFNMPG